MTVCNWDFYCCRFFRRIGCFIRCLARTGFVIINNIYCIPTYVLWMVLLFPIKFYQPKIYFRIEGLFFHWLLAMVSTWTWTAGYHSESTELKEITLNTLLFSNLLEIHRCAKRTICIHTILGIDRFLSHAMYSFIAESRAISQRWLYMKFTGDTETCNRRWDVQTVSLRG